MYTNRKDKKARQRRQRAQGEFSRMMSDVPVVECRVCHQILPDHLAGCSVAKAEREAANPAMQGLKDAWDAKRKHPRTGGHRTP